MQTSISNKTFLNKGSKRRKTNGDTSNNNGEAFEKIIGETGEHMRQRQEQEIYTLPGPVNQDFVQPMPEHDEVYGIDQLEDDEMQHENYKNMAQNSFFGNKDELLARKDDFGRDRSHEGYHDKTTQQTNMSSPIRVGASSKAGSKRAASPTLSARCTAVSLHFCICI